MGTPFAVVLEDLWWYTKWNFPTFTQTCTFALWPLSLFAKVESSLVITFMLLKTCTLGPFRTASCLCCAFQDVSDSGDADSIYVKYLCICKYLWFLLVETDCNCLLWPSSLYDGKLFLYTQYWSISTHYHIMLHKTTILARKEALATLQYSTCDMATWYKTLDTVSI